ncbi:MAG: hypothetical protein IH986_15390, partial [Planctomycetes bacterium]|nr:hypothetical protein [Planctomycetota bacterium]
MRFPSRVAGRVRMTAAMSTAVALGLVALIAASVRGPADLLEEADALAKEQNWAEAREKYDQARDAEADWRTARARASVEGAVECSMHLKEWDDALSRAGQYVEKVTGSLEEAVGRRLLAGLYLNVPHEGTKRGSTYLRGQWTQGVYVSSWKKDRRRAIKEYEKARALLAGIAEEAAEANEPPQKREQIEAERIGVDFDLASAITSIGSYQRYGYWWDWWWGWGQGDEEDSDAVDEADYEEPRRYWGWSQPQSPPTGVPVGADGRPRFITTPQRYVTGLGDGQKVRFLLDEIQKLDTSEKKDSAARALLRWAVIARSLYGPEVIANARAQSIRYDRFGRALPAVNDEEPVGKKLWELADDESITFVGGKPRLIKLPPAESPLAILRRLEAQFPESSYVPDAKYTRGLYYQTRQQFPQAIQEYDALIAAHPGSDRSHHANNRLSVIRKKDAMLDATGVYLPDESPKLGFTYRNTDAIEFTATEVDLLKFVRDGMENDKNRWWQYRNLSWSFFNEDPPRWRDYLGGKAAAWTERVPLLEDHRANEGHTLAPLSEPGAYVIEARPAGSDDVSRALLVVTDIAVVQKNLEGRGLIYVCDARSGRPLPDTAVRIYEHWSERKNDDSRNHWIDTVQMTNADGAIEYRRKHVNRGSVVDAIVASSGGRIALSFFQQWSGYVRDSAAQRGQRVYIVTDRPVYRPGDTVQYRAWVRNRGAKGYDQPRVDRSYGVEVYDPKGTRIESLSLKSDKFGGIHGAFTLGDEPPLGLYGIRVSGLRNDGIHAAGGTFRVEEYRKPEFEVLVEPSTTQARVGEKVKARIEARYYFGAPVAGGTATYKVFRETYHHAYWGAAEYDWLYGPGYGRCWYPYRWFGWWGKWGRLTYLGGPWLGGWGRGGDDFGGRSWREAYTSGTRKALRELVAQGKVSLGADGKYEIEFDTAKAKAEYPNDDHRYTIEVDVRDLSRRTISGRGSVIVTRQAFYAFIEADRGWYRHSDNLNIKVRTIAPDNTPIAAGGEVVVSRIEYGGPQNREVNEQEIRRWNAATDADGRLEFSFATAGPGQYRVTFVTRDAWGEEVQGNALLWVMGPDFDGRVYRFNEIEIITDKRTYQPGETAHLMVNTAEANARMIFSDDVVNGLLRSYRFIDLPNRTTIIDVPIDEGRQPNFFVEATLVRNGRVFTEQRELFVPPAEKLLNVAITTDKDEYQPGETGQVRVVVTDANGKPVTGQVTLTAFDEAVTYIQDEMSPSPKAFFHGQRRRSHVATEFSSEQTYYASGSLTAPDQLTYLQEAPEGWNGHWGVRLYGLAMADEDRLGGFGGGSGVRGGGFFESRSQSSFEKANERDLKAKMGYLDVAVNSPAALRESARGRRIGLAKGLPPGMDDLADAELRVDFSDTALWLPALELGPDGTAETEITFPQSLTTWRLRGYAISESTQVGDGRGAAKTTKNVLVRLQSPRFFVERDEVVLSAVAHNYLDVAKEVTAELIIPGDLLAPLDATMGGQGTQGPDKDGFVHLFGRATVASGGEHRFDWPVKVRKAGLAFITARAMTDVESDAMRMAFPVLVHGINKTVAHSGSYRVTDTGTREINFDLPAEIDLEQTKLEIVFAPTLAGVMLDALPYLAGYPYGCVEQTMSRFYPAVLVRHTLQEAGVDLETIAKRRKQMFEADLKNRFGRRNESPVFDSDELDRMIKAGLGRLYAMQHSDGGWGWWRDDESSPFQTAYIVQGLHAARTADVKVDDGVYHRAIQFLLSFVDAELLKKDNLRRLGRETTQAYLAYVLSLEKRLTEENHKLWMTTLYERREKLTNYGRALLALAMHRMDDGGRAQTLLRNLLQYVQRDDSNETAWVRTPGQSWWFWWNNDIETNAWALRALVELDPKSDLAPRIVKWLLNNRRNGYYWRSTRDTAQVIAAMSEFMRASGEGAPDYTLTIELDGRPLRELRVTPEDMFTLDNRVVLHGL